MSSRPPVQIQPVTRSFRATWVDFWFRPSPLQTLSALRVLFGLVALLWLLPLAGQVDAFFGLTGWLDTAALQQAAELRNQPFGPRAWSLVYLVGENSTALHAFYWGGLVVIVLFALGLFTRITSILAWLVVVSFTTNPLIESDADAFLRLLAFYLMVGYLCVGLLRTDRPLITRLLSPFDYFILNKNPGPQPASSAATLAVRLIQIHVALAVVAMALHKLQFAEWWAGVTFWYPLTRPSEINLDTLRAWSERSDYYLSLISLAAYAVLVWQLAFPFFAWRRGAIARWILLGGALLGCIGLITLYRQPLMGPVFLVLCLSYLTAQEWERITAPWTARLRGEG